MMRIDTILDNEYCIVVVLVLDKQVKVDISDETGLNSMVLLGYMD